MIQLPASIDVYFSTQPIDMRKAIDGLCALVSEVLESDPQAKSLYLFHNKARNKIKGIMWDGNGFIMIYKRLEKGRFKVPHNSKSNVTLSHEELRWLLAGLDFMILSKNPALMFNTYA